MYLFYHILIHADVLCGGLTLHLKSLPADPPTSPWLTVVSHSLPPPSLPAIILKAHSPVWSLFTPPDPQSHTH